MYDLWCLLLMMSFDLIMGSKVMVISSDPEGVQRLSNSSLIHWKSCEMLANNIVYVTMNICKRKRKEKRKMHLYTPSIQS